MKLQNNSTREHIDKTLSKVDDNMKHLKREQMFT